MLYVPLSLPLATGQRLACAFRVRVAYTGTICSSYIYRPHQKPRSRRKFQYGERLNTPNVGRCYQKQFGERCSSCTGTSQLPSPPPPEIRCFDSGLGGRTAFLGPTHVFYANFGINVSGCSRCRRESHGSMKRYNRYEHGYIHAALSYQATTVVQYPCNFCVY